MLLRSIIFIAFLIAIAMPTLSYSHAKVTKIFPSDQDIIATSPKRISLHFPELLQVTSFKLRNEVGETIDVQGGKSLTPSKEVIATPPELPKGIYEVQWRGLSADGHPIKGSFSFTISP